MPTIGAKVSQQELEAITEYANLHGITVSNLIRMVLVREVSAPRVIANNSVFEESDSEKPEIPRKKTMLERLAESARNSSQKSIK